MASVINPIDPRDHIIPPILPLTPPVENTAGTPAAESLPPAEEPKEKTLWEKTKEIAKKIADFVENIFWRYVKEANNIVKRVIKAVIITCKELGSNLSPVITKLGILSGVSTIFALKSIGTTGMSLADNIKLKDGEGIALSTLSLVTTPLDALDSFITTMEALAAFEVVPQIAFFSLIALPLAIGLVGYSAIRGLYDLIVCGINLGALPKVLEEGNLESFKAFLKSKIGVTAQEKEELEKGLEEAKKTLNETEFEALKAREIQIIKDRKRNIVSRQTDVRVYNIMKNLKQHLKSATPNLETANLALRDMKVLMTQKLIWGSLSTAANIAFFVTLACSAVFPIATYTIPIVAGTRAGLALGRHQWDHLWSGVDLKLPAFAKSAVKI